MLVSERLEPRRLLSGITLITHGYQSNGVAPQWIDRMAEAVDRAMAELGRMIARAINNRDNAATMAVLADEVRAICARFPVPGLTES